MAFNSIPYIFFFFLVFLLYLLVTDRWRWVVLLTASLVFYLSFGIPYLLLVLLLTTIVTYFFSILIDRLQEPWRKRVFWLGLLLNVSTLVIMKYLPFLTSNIDIGLGLIFPKFKIPIPAELVSIGISFYIFQAISYLANIYLEIDKPEKHFGYFALFQSFFPKLLQGPIERPGLLKQLRAPYEFNYENFRMGLLLFGWGLFKKTVIADRLAIPTNAVFDNISHFSGVTLIIAVLCYTFQIYFDFSGYTDMALGVARIFNIELTNNFNGPYLAFSIADFWKRWHISFSSWILDYIFKPLQMQFRRLQTFGTALALMITFLISGLWHGSSWGFVIWGGLHGFYMVIEAFYAPIRKKFLKKYHLEKNIFIQGWQIFSTFFLVSFAWIFFRANSINDVFYLFRNIYRQSEVYCGITLIKNAPYLLLAPNFFPTNVQKVIAVCHPIITVREIINSLGLETIEWAILAVLFTAYVIITIMGRKVKYFELPTGLRWSGYYLLILIIIFLEVPMKRAWFVYFRF